MRTHDTPRPGRKSLRLVVWFLLLLSALLVIAVSIKAIVMIGESVFDGKHRLTLFLTDKNKNAVVVSLEPQGKTILLRLSGRPTRKEAESALLTSFDGSIRHANSFSTDGSPQNILRSFLFTPGGDYQTVTPYDLLRLYLLSLQHEKDDGEEHQVTVSNGQSSLDKTERYFVDNGILTEGKTVAIVNSTGVSGLGQRLENVIDSLGGGVVSVTTGRDLQEPTHIFYTGEKSYSVQKIERIFHQQAEEGNTQAADILIVIGKRSLPLGIFATLEQ